MKTLEEFFSRPLLEMKSQEMANSQYSVLVMNYAFGQYRIQITDVTMPDPHAPQGHGTIVQEICTYDSMKMMNVVANLCNEKDPIAYANTLAKPWNREFPGGRIRLDNKPGNRSV